MKSYPPVRENDAVRSLIILIDRFSDIVYSDFRELSTHEKYFRHGHGYFRIGHTIYLRFIALDRAKIPDLKINYDWLKDFDEAARIQKKRKFRGYHFKE